MDPIILIFQLIVLIFSAIIHEVAHGAMAFKLGDNTAKDQGRLTLNPIKHIDPVGTIFLPLILFIFNSPIIFGWAKPVPYNPFNLKKPKRDAGLIAISGPVSNLLLAIIFSIILKVVTISMHLTELVPFVILINIIILVNIVLALFNLVPIPPLDGSKVLFALLPTRFAKLERFLEQYGFLILLIFLLFGLNLIEPAIVYIFHLLGGTLF